MNMLTLMFMLLLLTAGCGPIYTHGFSTVSPQCLNPNHPRSNIEHVVIVIQENHSFDSYFGNYCQAPTGSEPTCTVGQNCCEAGPTQVSGMRPRVLDDKQNIAFDPNHTQFCEWDEIDGGLMDRFVKGGVCSNPDNFAYADADTLKIYWDYARKYALADRYFQPAAGASSENDIYFARAAIKFIDDNYMPDAIGSSWCLALSRTVFTDPTIADLLVSCDVSWAFYAEGYQKASASVCVPLSGAYDPADNPFQYFANFRDNPLYEKDYVEFRHDVAAGTLPAVSFVKALNARSEHPGASIQAGERFVKSITDAILNSADYKQNTLILVVPDESGGFYDHVPPPPTSSVDGQAYGVRVPLLAIGYFANSNTISHVVMEHSSIVRFIEWNFLGGEPGQLGTRDAVVNGIGSLLDSTKTGQQVPF